MPDTRTRNLYCKLQNRLGALDRVLLALTHRGIIPERFVTEKSETGALEVAVAFRCEDARLADKLVKFLQKQVYVLEACLEKEAAYATAPAKVAPLFAGESYEFVQRRVAHGHNA